MRGNQTFLHPLCPWTGILFGHLRIMRHPCTKWYRYQCGNHSKGIFQDVNSIYRFSSYHIFLLYLFYIFNAYYEFLECYVSKLSCFGACFDKFFILLSWYSGIKKNRNSKYNRNEGTFLFTKGFLFLSCNISWIYSPSSRLFRT